MEKLARRLTLWVWWITSIQLVAGTGVLLVYWRKLPPQVPLLYTRPWGIDQLVHPIWLWALPGLGTFLGIITALFGSRLLADPVLQIILRTTIVIVQLILLLGLIRIILLIA